MDNNTNQEEQLNMKEDQQKADAKSIKVEIPGPKSSAFCFLPEKIKINIKAAIIIAVIIIASALVYTYKGLFVAATVNGSPISRLSVIQKLEKVSGKNLLDSLIIEKLIQNEANARKIVVSNDEINGEIKKIEDQIVAQGSTLDAALLAQRMDVAELRRQILFQKEIEKLVADKINVTDEEVAEYITNNKITVPTGQEVIFTSQIKDELRGQKLGIESNTLITALKSQAKIRYFVNY